MTAVYTNGRDKDFVALCGQLDDHLNQVVGEKQRESYVQYNTLESIHDVILLYDEDTPIACASFKKYDTVIAEVKRVFICKEYRGQGLSKPLMRLLEEKAKEKGFTKLILETGAVLKEATALYERIGFSRMENYGQYKGMKASICMEKEIQPHLDAMCPERC